MINKGEMIFVNIQSTVFQSLLDNERDRDVTVDAGDGFIQDMSEDTASCQKSPGGSDNHVTSNHTVIINT